MFRVETAVSLSVTVRLLELDLLQLQDVGQPAEQNIQHVKEVTDQQVEIQGAEQVEEQVNEQAVVQEEQAEQAVERAKHFPAGDGHAFSEQQQGGLQANQENIVPLTKHLNSAILNSPATVNSARRTKGKENIGSSYKEITDSKRRSERLANKPKCNLTMEEQATKLLMKKIGTLDAQQDGIDKFAQEFTRPIQTETVKGYRELFDLPEVGEPDILNEVALEAECC